MAAERERGDRVAGIAASQAVTVHTGVTYDIEVDTSAASPNVCGQRIAALVGD